jgi:hypothetical protein
MKRRSSTKEKGGESELKRKVSERQRDIHTQNSAESKSTQATKTQA